VNRLYAGLPAAAVDDLDDEDKDALRVLALDHHITVDAHEGRPGVWLSHPHLTDALFRGWFYEDEPHKKAGALRDGILLCKQHGASPAEQTAPLWALARALTGDAEHLLAERVDRDFAAPMLEKVHKDYLKSDQRLPLEHLAVWLRIAELVPGMHLHPAPLQDALEQLLPERMEETGFRLTCHIMLSHMHHFSSNDRLRALSAIRKVLDVAAGWRQWPFVAIDLFKHTIAEEDGERLVQWAQANMTASMTPRLLAEALKIPSTEARSREVALSFAQQAPGGTAWAELYEQLTKMDDDNEIVVGWALRHAAEPRSTFVLYQLLLKRHPKALLLARRWLEENNQSPVANYLIEELLHREEAVEFAELKAQQWIDPAYVGSDRLIEWLMERSPNANLLETAFQWLDRHQDARGWAHVLQKLLDVVQSEAQREQLIMRGFNRLEGHEDEPGWAHVLQKLLDVAQSEAQREQLIMRGFNWLEGHEDEPEWNYVL
ncbi:MAG: hypothetical protein MJA29_06150, partial [Candidatus Omnitrophica bacterium]|nr:hypothetical protein [Candidatus Omnitrophota bacterium]